MTESSLQIIAGLPPRVQTLIDDTLDMAKGELNVRVVDSSMVLLRIAMIHDNSAAKWLKGVGVDEKKILHYIHTTFESRGEPELRKNAFDEVIPVEPIMTFPLSIIQMVKRLHDRMLEPGTNRQVYISDVLEAIAHTDSRAVLQIFGSVGITMAELREKLKPPTVEDLEKLYARRN